MNFNDWKQLAPKDAAREVRRRVEALLPSGQRRAAIAALSDEDALTRAFAAAPRGPLGGVPYLLKDLFDVAGLPTLAGATFVPEIRPTPARDGAIVGGLRDLGAVFAGKTHLFECAWGLTGENPHYGDCERPGFPGRTSGGSSSGSAVLVAAGVVPLAIATDTGGSVRVPAAFCGIHGFRGVPHHPWIADAFPLAQSFDTAGWFTGTAADMRTTLAALVGSHRPDRAPRGCRLELPGLDPEVAAAFHSAAGRLAPEPDAATRDALLASFAPAAEHYNTLASREALAVHAPWADRFRDRYGPVLRERLDRARRITPAAAEAAAIGAAEVRSCMSGFFRAFDFLILPATPFAALAKEACTQESRLRMIGLTAPASLSGVPVLTLPVPLASGLTTGLQVIAADPKSPVFDWALASAP
jgi:aspartyl-tRNA(Asn)/glutamyl-tRNA(Gln) amidotransferase subunit A